MVLWPQVRSTEPAMPSGPAPVIVAPVAVPEPVRPALPVRLKISAIGVDAAIEYVGLNPDGTMVAPTDTSDVAWLQLGSRPGEAGVAVIAGHFGRSNGKPSVFDHLYQLKPGAQIVVVAADGASYTYIMRAEQRFTPKGDAAVVFDSLDSGSHLNLITCEGVWDAKAKSFTARLVVFTDRQL